MATKKAIVIGQCPVCKDPAAELTKHGGEWLCPLCLEIAHEHDDGVLDEAGFGEDQDD